MNFVYLVESGKYDKSMLSEREKQYIAGMEDAIAEIDTVSNLLESELDKNNVYHMIQREIIESTCREIKAQLYARTCERIVALADGNSDSVSCASKECEPPFGGKEACDLLCADGTCNAGQK